jgi:hypothetical protein
MAFRKWCSFSLRETFLILAILGCFFAWLRDYQAIRRAEALFGQMDEAFNTAKSFRGGSALIKDLDGIEIEWAIYPPLVLDEQGIEAHP